MKTFLMAALAAAALFAAPGAIAKPQPAQAAQAEEAHYTVVQENARVYAPSYSTRGFTVAHDRSIILRGNGDRWYRAVLYEPCASLVSGGSRIRFEARPADVLDRWAHVRVDGERCSIRRFDQIERPVTPS
jgi:hypothetical protein